MPMRILFLSPRQSFPARSGARLRESHFLRALGAGAEVSFLYFADPGATPLTISELPFCREVVALDVYMVERPALGEIVGDQGLTMIR